VRLNLALSGTGSWAASFRETTLGPAFCVGRGTIVCVNTCHTEGITFAASEEARSIIHVLADAFGLRKQISLECLYTESQAECPTWICTVSCIKFSRAQTIVVVEWELQSVHV
jgi:hypothetical protein